MHCSEPLRALPDTARVSHTATSNANKLHKDSLPCLVISARSKRGLPEGGEGEGGGGGEGGPAGEVHAISNSVHGLQGPAWSLQGSSGLSQTGDYESCCNQQRQWVTRQLAPVPGHSCW